MIRYLLALLLLCSPALANETVLTVCASGCDYATPALCEAGTTVDVTALGHPQVCSLFSSAGPTTAKLTIAGATVSADYYRVFRGAPSELTASNSGKPTTTGRHYFGTSADDNVAVAEGYVRLANLQVITSTGASPSSGINLSNGHSPGIVTGCIIDITQSADTQTAVGMNLNGGSVSADLYANNLIRLTRCGGCTGTITGIVYGNTFGYAAVTANNTIVGPWTTGVLCNEGTSSAKILLKNNIFTDNIVSVSNPNSGSTTNICDDSPSTCPATGAIAGEPTFVGKSTGDYHLATADTLARNAGADLSATFTTDIDGQTRSAWDVGADEWSAAQQPQTAGGALMLFDY